MAALRMVLIANAYYEEEIRRLKQEASAGYGRGKVRRNVGRLLTGLNISEPFGLRFQTEADPGNSAPATGTGACPRNLVVQTMVRAGF